MEQWKGKVLCSEGKMIRRKLNWTFLWCFVNIILELFQKNENFSWTFEFLTIFLLKFEFFCYWRIKSWRFKSINVWLVLNITTSFTAKNHQFLTSYQVAPFHKQTRLFNSPNPCHLKSFTFQSSCHFNLKTVFKNLKHKSPLLKILITKNFNGIQNTQQKAKDTTFSFGERFFGILRSNKY